VRAATGSRQNATGVPGPRQTEEPVLGDPQPRFDQGTELPLEAKEASRDQAAHCRLGRKAEAWARLGSSNSENLFVAFAGGKSSCERTGSSRLQRGSRDGMRIPLGAGERVAVREEQLVDSGLGLPELMA